MDDDWGWKRQQLEVKNLSLLRPEIIKALQGLLAPYPDWSITVSVVVPESGWPGMGIVIYPDEIFDELQRDYLPEEFRNLSFS